MDDRQALEGFREQGGEIAPVILDLDMPEMGGVEEFRAVRRRGDCGIPAKAYALEMLRETRHRVFG